MAGLVGRFSKKSGARRKARSKASKAASGGLVARVGKSPKKGSNVSGGLVARFSKKKKKDNK